MKTPFGSLFKNSAVYGLVMAAIMIVISLLIYLLDVNMYTIVGGILSFVIFVLALPITLMILSGNSLRKQYAPNRQLSYLDALLNSFILLVIGFILSNLFSYVLNTWIAPGYLNHQVQMYMDMMNQYNVPQDQIDKGIERIHQQNNVGYNMMVSLISAAVLALLVSLVIRKKDKVDDKGV